MKTDLGTSKGACYYPSMVYQENTHLIHQAYWGLWDFQPSRQ